MGRVAENRGVTVAIGQRANDEPTYPDAEHLATNDAAVDALANGSLDVVGGTTWLWAREDMIKSIDVLFIDEAGQMSLADAIAASLSAMNLVLLGDPQQLDQPLQGVHPPGAARSALAHVLHGRRVMPGSPRTFSRRKLAATSGDQRLHVRGVLRRAPAFAPRSRASRPQGCATLSGTGIRFVPVPHIGQSSDSPEEAGNLADLVHALMDVKPTYTDPTGLVHSLCASDVLVITPYNAQVRAIRGLAPRLPRRHR